MPTHEIESSRKGCFSAAELTVVLWTPAVGAAAAAPAAAPTPAAAPPTAAPAAAPHKNHPSTFSIQAHFGLQLFSKVEWSNWFRGFARGSGAGGSGPAGPSSLVAAAPYPPAPNPQNHRHQTNFQKSAAKMGQFISSMLGKKRLQAFALKVQRSKKGRFRRVVFCARGSAPARSHSGCPPRCWAPSAAFR
eukprot:COSAG04_NODE_175_length_21521_cov_167.404071_7_plen_190_part_00